MRHEHSQPHRAHHLVVRIEPADGEFEASIREADSEATPHFVMSGPPASYAEVVDELVEALRRHLLEPGE